MNPEELGLHIQYVTTFQGAGAKAAYDMDRQLRESVNTSATAWQRTGEAALRSGQEQAKAGQVAAATAREVAQAQVDASVKQREALKVQAHEYYALAAAAKRGSAEQVAATELATKAVRQLGLGHEEAAAMSKVAAASMIADQGRIAAAGRVAATSVAAAWRRATATEAAEGAGAARMGRSIGLRGLFARGAGRTGEAAVRGGAMGGAIGLGGAGTALIGGAIAAFGVKDILDASKAMQTAQAQVQNTLHNVGISWQANRAEIERTTNTVSKYSGFLRTELLSSFTTLVRMTKNVGQAERDTALAADVSRARHIGLEQATKMVLLAQSGHVGILRRLGINITTVTTAEDALRTAHAKVTPEVMKQAKAYDLAHTGLSAINQLQRAYAGSAETYGKTAAGSTARFQASVEELEVSLGKVLLPTLARVLNSISNWLNRVTESGHAASVMKGILAGVTAVFNTIWPTIKLAAEWVGKLGQYLAKHTTTAKLFGVALAAIFMPGGPLVSAVVVAVALIIKHWDSIRKALEKIHAAVYNGWIAMINAIEKAFGAFVAKVGGMLAGIPSWLPGLGKFHAWGENLQQWAGTLGHNSGYQFAQQFNQSVKDALPQVQAELQQTLAASAQVVDPALAASGNMSPSVNLPASSLASGSIAKFIRQRAGRYNLDPRAVLGVAGNEGLSGRPGDYGRFSGGNFIPMKPGSAGGEYTSFGPFQLHATGALPDWVWKRGPAFAQTWATSKAGVDYALSRIGSVAGGKTGPAAIAAIVSGFERPGDLRLGVTNTADYRAALAAYSKMPGALPDTSGAGTGGTDAVPTAVTEAVAKAHELAAQKARDKLAKERARAARAAAAALRHAQAQQRKFIESLNAVATQTIRVAESQYKLDHDSSALTNAMDAAEAEYGKAGAYATAHGLGAVATQETARGTVLRNQVTALIQARAKQAATQALAEAKRAAVAAAKLRARILKAQQAVVLSALTGVSATEADIGRDQTVMQRQMTAGGIDSGSVLGSDMLASSTQGEVTRLGGVQQQLQQALRYAQGHGLNKLAARVQAALADVIDRIDEAVANHMAAVQQSIKQAAQDAVDLSQHKANMVGGEYQALVLGQRLGMAGLTSGTPGYNTLLAGQDRAQAAFITGSVIPSLRGQVGPLQAQLAAAQRGTPYQAAVGRSGSFPVMGTAYNVDQKLVQQLAESLQNLQNEITQKQVDAATLLKQAADSAKQAAEDSAQAISDAAQHGTNMAEIGLRHLELTQQLNNTFDTLAGAQQRADYIRNTVIPALQSQIGALQNQQSVAQAQGDQALADQIAEAIGNKQNDILQEQLDAQNAIKDAMGKLVSQFGGSLGFQFGGMGMTDMLVAAGAGA